MHLKFKVTWHVIYSIGGYEVLTEATKSNEGFRVVIPCSSEGFWHFRGKYHLCLQGKRVSEARNQQEVAS